jgi:hypothetical protein
MATIKKPSAAYQAGGTVKSTPKAPDKTGDYITVQKRNLPKAKSGAKLATAKGGKWIQKASASIKRRGTEGKCTPITKPGCTGRAKALAKTFKAMAKRRKNK